jgi:hypothetical protein
MSDALLAQSSLAFDTVQQTSAKKPSVTGVKRSILIYRLPAGMDDATRLSCMAALTLCGKSDETEVRPWQTWIGTYVCIAFEEFAGRIAAEGKDEYRLEDLPTTFVDAVQNANNRDDLDKVPALLPIPDGLPPTTGAYTTFLYNCSKIEGVYGYLSLMTFLMGKRINDQNRASIETKRPGNLVQAWSPGDAEYILTGAGKMGRKAHEMVPIAWDQSAILRELVVREFITFSGSKIHPMEVTATLFRMIEHSGMQGALFAHRLLQSCPWVSEIPILKPDIAVYAQSVQLYLSLPAEERGFTKLIKGNTTKIFRAKSMPGLIKCAWLWISQSEPSTAQYTAPGGDEALKAFVKAAHERGIVLKDHSQGGIVLMPIPT